MNGRRGVALGIFTVTLAALLFVVGGIGGIGRERTSTGPPPSAVGRAGSGQSISALQARLRSVPADYVAWASLGLAYVDQARLTADPSYYVKAEGAIERSLSLDSTENFIAHAGMAALQAARHEFGAAEEAARRGLAINPSSAPLHGALADALIQLGRYSEAFEAIQRMVDLRPDTASLSRASYAWELRGDVGQATANMQRALEDAASPADRAFGHYHLGELALNSGDPARALEHYRTGLVADPSYARLLQGRARAHAALGQFDAAVADYSEVVQRVPEPAYLIEFGELLQSLGRTEEAGRQFAVFGEVTKLFEANSVILDVDQTLFHADHGDPGRALEYGETGRRSRQFLDMDDAYAWALHANGRHAEALEWSRKALALGSRNALFHYHAGMIHRSLGNRQEALDHLTTALEINPHFNPLWAPVARGTLEELRRSA